MGVRGRVTLPGKQTMSIVEDSPVQPPPKLTTHLLQIEQAVRDVTYGQIGINEFAAVVIRMERLFRQKLDEVREIVRDEVPADFLVEIADEMDVGQRGIELYIDAMKDLHEYIRSRDLDPIERSLEKCRQANELVNLALVKNWQTYYTYQQAAEEFIKQTQV